ncbi:helix-turn-helix transcriptional regulator [Microbacterium allomyrinae]|uniref:Helix-turn-helix domain-containing protein n=1 Tax=Microbacterium allomyrinae TaxID=2830666 RepID=A0A9X1LRT6_9MICO|nr:helix-turn-helix domain-containing protein [Microbacterium allomyrinae]MCC2030632.1 helix-turn-helix domain-containing protein [Microbacterium allomyrinae]
MMPTPDRWLTLSDAAKRVGRTERTLRNWVAADEIKPTLKRFRESDLIVADKRMRAKVGRSEGGGERLCAWCRGPIPATLRADAVCCSKRCRQARHRFASGVGVAPAGGHDVLRLAYADPPYPGLSKRYYGDHPDYAGEVDHRRLVEQLDGYDGWALSTSARALKDVLALCPPGSRVAAWVRGERPTRSAGPLNAWEPVIYWGGRRDASRSTTAGEKVSRLTGVERHVAGESSDTSRAPGRRVAEDLGDTSRHAAADASGTAADDASRGSARRVDVLTYRPGARTTEPGRVVGAKPAEFCRWVFDLLGAEPQDEFTDVFPGSGGVQRAWDVFAA